MIEINETSVNKMMKKNNTVAFKYRWEYVVKEEVPFFYHCAMATWSSVKGKCVACVSQYMPCLLCSSLLFFLFWSDFFFLFVVEFVTSL